MVEKSTDNDKGCHDTIAPVLDFSGSSSMTLPDCDLLCENIVNSDSLLSIRFSDCLLPEDIAKSVINALANCKSIKVADFKGNNFRVNGAEQLCNLLKQTTTLTELYLEWNSLGLNDASMETIADGLAENKSVEILDLSRNQISHSGGKFLSSALRRNNTLKSLDLRWNNIGVAGGRELLSALQHNKSLVNIQLDGNNILGDTLKAILSAIQRNVDHQNLCQQRDTMLQPLKDEIHRIENEKIILENKLETEKELNESTNCKLEDLKSTLDRVNNEKLSRENDLKSASEKISSLVGNLSDVTKIHSELRSTHLEETTALDKSISELKSTLDHVSNEKVLRENELKTANENISSLEENISDLTKINSELRKTHSEEIKILEERLSSERQKWEIEISTKDSSISTLQKEKETEHNQNEKKLIEINNLQNLLKLKEDNQIVDEQKYQRDKERINKEYEEQVKSLTDKITKYLHDKEELEEDITKLKTSNINNKLMFDEELGNQRSRWKEEDAFKSKQYEEKIDILVAAKNDLQSTISTMTIQETEIRANLVASQKDIENYKQVIVQNKESANIRDEEYRKQINKLQQEIDQEKRDCRNVRAKLEDAEKKNADMQCEMNHMKNIKDKEIEDKDKEVLSLKEIVKNEGNEIVVKDNLILTLGKENETQHNQNENNQIEINNLQTLLKLKEENQIMEEQKYQRDKERINKEYEEHIKSLTDKITKYLRDKDELEGEITKLKTSNINNKLMFDEELENQRSKWKEEDAFKSKQYEEKIDILVAAKNELQSTISTITIQETEIRAKLVACQKDIENSKQVIVQNQESTNICNQEHRNEITKLQQEIDQEKRNCNNLLGKLEDTEKKYADMQCEMTHIKNVKDMEIEDKEKEITSLKEIVKNEGNEIVIKDNLIITLGKENETQHNQNEKKQIEINNLQTLLKLKEENQIADEQKYQAQKERFNKEYEEHIQSLTDKIMKHLQDKEQLEQEITKLKTIIMNSKIVFDEELANQRSKWKEEDDFKSKQYEDRIDILVASKEELQSKISWLMIQETELRAKLIACQKDIESYKQVIVENEESANLRDQKHRNEINKLQNEIDQEERECMNLRAKVEETEKKYADIQCEMTQMRTAKDSEIALKENEILAVKEIVKNGDDDIATKDSLIAELLKENETQHEQNEKHQIEINNLQKVLKLKEENQIADEKKYQSEKEKINREYEEQVKSITGKVTKYLQDTKELEEEITKLKTSNINNKLMFDEELTKQRAKWKEEDAFKSNQYEERIDILVASKDELQSKISWLVIQETETHAKLVGHQKNIEKSQRDIENYKQVIAQNQESANLRDQEHRNEINKLQQEIDQEKRECRNLCMKLEDAEKKIADMQCEMTQLKAMKDSEIADKDNEILSLKERVKNEEEDIKRIREEELSRSNMLESALQTYIQSSRSAKE